MTEKVNKILTTLEEITAAYYERLDMLVAKYQEYLPGARPLIEQASDRSNILPTSAATSPHQLAIERLAARRQSFEIHQTDMRIPAALRTKLAKAELHLLRREFALAPCISVAQPEKMMLAWLFEKVERILNPVPPFSTTNEEFKTGERFRRESVSRAYDEYVWEVLKDHFEDIPAADGQQSQVKIVSALPEKEEYLRLKDYYFTISLEILVGQAFDEVRELQYDLEDDDGFMPELLPKELVSEAQLEAARDLNRIASDAPSLPDCISAVRIVHVSPLRQGSGWDRVCEVVSKLRAVETAIREYKTSTAHLIEREVAALDYCIERLDDCSIEIGDIDFPGMYG